jgi:hypothetical protein
MKHFTKRNKTLYKKRATKRKTFKRKGGIGFFGNKKEKENKINYFDKNINNTEDDDFEKLMTEEIKHYKNHKINLTLTQINGILRVYLEQKIKTGKFIDIKNDYKDALMNYATKTNDKKFIGKIVETINTNKVSEWLKIPIPTDEEDLLKKYSDLDKIIKEFKAIYNYGYKNNMKELANLLNNTEEIDNLFINNRLEFPPVKKENNKMMAFLKDYKDYLNNAFPIPKEELPEKELELPKEELELPKEELPELPKKLYTENPMLPKQTA